MDQSPSGKNLGSHPIATFTRQQDRSGSFELIRTGLNASMLMLVGFSHQSFDKSLEFWILLYHILH